MKSVRGFTLLELMIGLVLLGFILALAYGGFRLASQAWDSVATGIETTADRQLAQAFLRRLLTQLQPVRWTKAVDQPLSFVGESKKLRAVAPISGQLRGGLQAVEISGEPAAGKDGPERLVLRFSPLNRQGEHFDDDLAAADAKPILGKLSMVEFEYFGSEKPDSEPQWSDHWSSPERLPQLIRLRLNSTETGWGDLIVAPMINSAGCRWSTFYGRCM